MKKIRTTILLPLIILTIISPLFAKDIQCIWNGIERIIAVGDIHGDYKSFVKILKKTGLIDENLIWKGGKTHLVQTGDIMDRGPDAKKVFDLIMRLEKEAEAAGGKVHMLIGDHEEVNITGIALDYYNYVTPEQFVSFIPQEYRERREKKQKEKLGNKAFEGAKYDFSLSSYLKNFWSDVIKKERTRKNGQARMIYVNTFNDQYGKWILEHNAVIKINDIVFAHGGISKKYSTWKLENINYFIRYELIGYRLMIKGFSRPSSMYKIVYDSRGPLWYRELARQDEEAFKPKVDEILKDLNAQYMVIAHSALSDSPAVAVELMSRFEGRIWVIDTSISEYIPGGFPSALIIENGKFSVFVVTDE